MGGPFFFERKKPKIEFLIELEKLQAMGIHAGVLVCHELERHICIVTLIKKGAY